MATLWEIDGRVLALEEALAAAEITPPAEGEDDPAAEALAEFEAELDAARGELHDKVDGAIALVRHLRGQAEMRKAEADRLAALAKADAARAARIEAFLLGYFQARGIERIETRRFRLGVARNGGKAPIEVTCAPEELPEEFRRVKFEVDKDALREALEAGELLEGVRLLERGYRLSIR